jgi:hypothetical protein
LVTREGRYINIKKRKYRIMIYYDLFLRCAPERSLRIDINPHFYHAFDMDAKSLNYARKKSTKRNIDVTPSSILQRKRSSQPSAKPKITTRRVSFSPNNSASKQISFDYVITPSQNTHNMKTPQPIANAISQLDDAIQQKTSLDTG